MGWLRLVGSLKLQVSFATEPYKRDYILQKSFIIVRSLRIVPTPYHVLECVVTHSYVRYECAFAKEPYKRDYILQKRRLILRSLLIVATPYHELECVVTHLCVWYECAFDLLYVSTHTHARAPTHTHTHTYMHTRTHIHAHTHARTHTHTHTHKHTHTHTHTHTQTHTHTHTHTHTQDKHRYPKVQPLVSPGGTFRVYFEINFFFESVFTGCSEVYKWEHKRDSCQVHKWHFEVDRWKMIGLFCKRALQKRLYCERACTLWSRQVRAHYSLAMKKI